MRSIKLIAVDIDDTLARSGKIIEINRPAIHKAVAQGIVVVLITARRLRSTLGFAQELELRTPVVCHGGAMACLHDKSELWHTRIPLDSARLIAELADKCDIELSTEVDNIAYFRRRPNQTVGWMADDCYVVEHNLDAMTAAPTRIIAHGPEASHYLLDTIQKTPEIEVGMYRTYRDGRLESITLINAQASKGDALRRMYRYFDIPNYQCMAIGDGESDITMLQAAGLAVAVAGAPPDVLQSSDFIAPTCEQGAVAWAIESFVLNHN